MELDHSFRVPADLDTVWRAVLDPERVAPCMPGATLTAADGASFSGTVKVKMGPISLLYKGSGEFLEADEQARRVVIKAAGKDARGNGTAAATVTVSLRADGDGTAGSVHTELSVTGKPAQFGRGMISEVGGKILESFAACLATKLGEQQAPPATQSSNGGTATKAPAAKKAAGGTGSAAAQPAALESEPATGSALAQPAASEPEKAAEGAGSTAAQPAAPEPEPAFQPEPAAESERRPQLTVVDPAGERTTSNGAAEARPASQEAEPIDLLAYAGPSVLKRAAPVLVALLAVLAIVALRRRSR